jgi:hypothetical protein
MVKLWSYRETRRAEIKHGKHNQASHGRKGRAGKAGSAAYKQARAGGASVAEAREVGRAATADERLKERGEVAARRISGLEARQNKIYELMNSGNDRTTPVQRQRYREQWNRLDQRIAKERSFATYRQEALDRGETPMRPNRFFEDRGGAVGTRLPNAADLNEQIRSGKLPVTDVKRPNTDAAYAASVAMQSFRATEYTADRELGRWDSKTKRYPMIDRSGNSEDLSLWVYRVGKDTYVGVPEVASGEASYPLVGYNATTGQRVAMTYRDDEVFFDEDSP